MSNNRRKRKLSKKGIAVLLSLLIFIMILVVIDSINKVNKYEENKKDNKPNDEGKGNYIYEEDIFDEYNIDKKFEKVEYNKTILEVSFEKDLYDKTSLESNQEYFENAINKLVNKYGQDISIKDYEKNIEIEITVNSKKDYDYTINSTENYFERYDEKKDEINNQNTIKPIYAKISHQDLNSFKSNTWSVKAAGVEIKEKCGDYLDYGNYKVFTHNIFIDSIEYDSNFENEILDEIKVGDSFEKIEENLGEPTFKTENMIGYKTYNTYAYFYEDKAVLYPSMVFLDTNSFENLIEKLIDGEEYKNNRSLFAYEVIHNYLDFSSKIDENDNLILKSPSRGIIIKIDNENNYEITVYNNYLLTQRMKNFILQDKVKTNFENDLTYITEIEKNK